MASIHHPQLDLAVYNIKFYKKSTHSTIIETLSTYAIALQIGKGI